MKPNVYKDLDYWRFEYPCDSMAVCDELWSYIEINGTKESLAQVGFKKIADAFPECHIDAYVHLSMSCRKQNKTEEALQYAITSYMIGMQSFPNSFDHDKDELIWGIIENRPFLRSMHVLGLEFMRRKDLVRAEKLFKQILIYNPNDNQGVRYLLAEIYHNRKDSKKLKILNKKYDGENLMEEVFSWEERILESK